MHPVCKVLPFRHGENVGRGRGTNETGPNHRDGTKQHRRNRFQNSLHALIATSRPTYKASRRPRRDALWRGALDMPTRTRSARNPLRRTLFLIRIVPTIARQRNAAGPSHLGGDDEDDRECIRIDNDDPSIRSLRHCSADDGGGGRAASCVIDGGRPCECYAGRKDQCCDRTNRSLISIFCSLGKATATQHS
ncbi:hypothetical protein SAMN05216228_102192 [Rhizobium tibeticum]|uniref:Uncharacterized protein n=1 Tax=Rhizobium tibeticum TaxID=501024 RepID=A0A1H8RFQ5_9HYPH|nr:hypothetical protein RTCCBAU85039_4192 [Rhizobium tibeticum]SEO65271.1 hypothetical protein SAMN05216228_102192 [Rhizobium tibeticum]